MWEPILSKVQVLYSNTAAFWTEVEVETIVA